MHARHLARVVPILVLVLAASGCIFVFGSDHARSAGLDQAEYQPTKHRVLVPFLCDLHPKSTRTRVFGDEVSVIVEIENLTGLASPEFDATVEVLGPSIFAQTFTAHFTSIPGRGSVEMLAGTLVVPLAERPVTITLVVTADPTSAGNPGGQVWEWNESNNLGTFDETVR